MADQIIEVWLGAFNEYHAKHRAQPGDAWVAARVVARKSNGEVWAVRVEGRLAAWIKPDHYREIAE